MPIWPRVKVRDLDLRGAAGFRTPAQGPLTITAWRVTGGGGGKSLQAADADLAPVTALYGPDSLRIDSALASLVRLDFADAAGRDNLVLLANASLDKPGSARVLTAQSVPAAALFAYPNPVRRSGGLGRLFFSRLDHGVSLRIFDEAGAPVQALEFSPDSSLWSWDLRDGSGRAAAPGVYYYRASDGPLAPFLLY
jgi:hypothetical protein